MRIKLIEIQANPFRNIRNYPFDKIKVEQLKNSINETGFWDNILARIKNGKVQIAYGHHRIEALRQIHAPSYEIDIIIKSLSDEKMLKIMANENMQEWATNMRVVDEVVNITMNYLKGNTNNKITAIAIANFLGWNRKIAEDSVTRINAVESGEFDYDIIYSLNSQRASTRFIAESRRLRVNKPNQRKAVEKLNTLRNKGKINIKHALLESINKTPESITKPIILEIENTCSNLIIVLNSLDVLTNGGADLHDNFYKNILTDSLKTLNETIEGMFKSLNLLK